MSISDSCGGTETVTKGTPIWIVAALMAITAIASGLMSYGAAKLHEDTLFPLPAKNSHPYVEYYDAKCRETEGKTYDPLSDIANPFTRYKNAKQPYQVAGKKPRDPDWCALVAQHLAAVSGRRSAVASTRTMWLTLCGVILLTITMMFTKQTLGEAKDATKAARQSADAAIMAANTASDQLRVGVKPFLSVEISGQYMDIDKFVESQFVKDDGPPHYLEITANLSVTNKTKNVATIVYAFASADTKIAPSKTAADFGVLLEGERYKIDWSNGAKYQSSDTDKQSSFGVFVVTNYESRIPLLTGQGPPIIGKVQYLDSLNNIYELGFAFMPDSIPTTDGWHRWGGDEYNYDRQIPQHSRKPEGKKTPTKHHNLPFDDMVI